MMVIGTLALTGVGIPHLFGFRRLPFQGRDHRGDVCRAQSGISRFAFWGLVVAAFMTSFYSWRLIFMTFHQSPRWGAGRHHTMLITVTARCAPYGTPRMPPTRRHGHGDHHHEPHESPLVMLIPLFVLALGRSSPVSSFRSTSLARATTRSGRRRCSRARTITSCTTCTRSPAGSAGRRFAPWPPAFALSWLYYIKSPWLPAATARTFEPIYKFFLNKWYFDELYDFLFVRPAFWIGNKLWKVGDGKIIDGLGPDGISARVQDATKGIVKLQTGYVYHYAFAMMIGVAVLVTWFSFGGNLPSLLGKGH